MAMRIGFALAALVATLAITACGSDDSGDDSGGGESRAVRFKKPTHGLFPPQRLHYSADIC